MNKVQNHKIQSGIASMLIAMAAAMGGSNFANAGSASPTRKTRKPAPMMVTASLEEIAAWNEAVDERKDAKPRPNTHEKTLRQRMNLAMRGADDGQHPKFPKACIHKQHKHPLRDERGAYTLTGGSIDRETGEYIRRIWLGGISAQRGY